MSLLMEEVRGRVSNFVKGLRGWWVSICEASLFRRNTRFTQREIGLFSPGSAAQGSQEGKGRWKRRFLVV